jgi:hypothetical protein
MKKTLKKHDDGLEWLRNLRRRIAIQCEHDLSKQAAFYRETAAKHSYISYVDDATVVGLKKRPANVAQKPGRAVKK